MAEVEVGLGKSGRRAYGFDDIAIVPSRRTRDPEDVNIKWEIDAFSFDLPLMASAMDGVVSPSTAIEIGRLGGVGVLNLEGLLTGPLFLCKIYKYHIKIMEPQREQLKLRLRQVELALDALKAEIYSDVDAYSTVNTANKVLTDYDEIFEDDDG